MEKTKWYKKKWVKIAGIALGAYFVFAIAIGAVWTAMNPDAVMTEDGFFTPETVLTIAPNEYELNSEIYTCGEDFPAGTYNIVAVDDSVGTVVIENVDTNAGEVNASDIDTRKDIASEGFVYTNGGACDFPNTIEDVEFEEGDTIRTTSNPIEDEGLTIELVTTEPTN